MNARGIVDPYYALKVQLYCTLCYSLFIYIYIYTYILNIMYYNYLETRSSCSDTKLVRQPLLGVHAMLVGPYLPHLNTIFVIGLPCII